MTPADIIQEAQTALGKLQMTYRDSQPQFWALALAWEAARFAWYVASNDLDTAREKLARVRGALQDVERVMQP